MLGPRNYIKNDTGSAIVIVGLGTSSLGVARAATRLGLCVIGLDRNPRAAGSRLVDHQLLQSTHDESVDAQLRAIDIRGVICSSSAPEALRTAAAIAQVLDVAGPAQNVNVFNDKLLLAQTLGELSPHTSLERASIGSVNVYEKPRFGHGLHPSNHNSVFQERLHGKEFFVGGVAGQSNSSPSVVLRKHVSRTPYRQVHSYTGLIRKVHSDNYPSILSKNKSDNAALTQVWKSAQERLSTGQLFLGMDCIIDSKSGVPRVIDCGPLWDLGLEHLLPIVGIDVQQQLVASFLDEQVGTPRRPPIGNHMHSAVQFSAVAEVLATVPVLTSLSVSYRGGQ